MRERSGSRSRRPTAPLLRGRGALSTRKGTPRRQPHTEQKLRVEVDRGVQLTPLGADLHRGFVDGPAGATAAGRVGVQRGGGSTETPPDASGKR